VHVASLCGLKFSAIDTCFSKHWAYNGKIWVLLRATATTRSAYLVMGCLRRETTLEWPPLQTHAKLTHIWWTTLRAQSYIRTADHACRNSLERSRAWYTNDALNISSSKTLVAIRVVHSSTTLSGSCGMFMSAVYELCK
jgi:hypothetical protein